MAKRKKSTKRKPIGYTRVKKKYALVFGTKSKPKLGKGRYSSKASLSKAAKRYL